MKINNIIRYMGAKDIDDRLISTITDEIALSDEIVPCIKQGCFDIKSTDEDVIELINTDIKLKGNLAKRTFGDCKSIIVIFATLTLKSELLLKSEFSKGGVNGVVLDAVLTEKLESELDKIEEGIRSSGKYTIVKNRISCGYGDLDIKIQKDLFYLLDCCSTGARINDEFMLYPNKSVIALLGVK